MDFCVTKSIPQDFATVKSCFDLSLDHSLVLVTLATHAKNRQKQPCFDLSLDHSLVLVTLATHTKNRQKQPCLSNRYTNWDDFRHLVNEKRTLKVPLKTEENIKAAVKFFNDTIQWAG
jgi:hypothetical protein